MRTTNPVLGGAESQFNGRIPIHGTTIIDLPSIAKSTTVNVDTPVAELITTNTIYVQCQSDLEHGLICIGAYCPVNGTLRIRISNLSASVIDGASRTWAYQSYV